MNTLLAMAVAQAVLYSVIAWLSGAFAYGTNEVERPILAMLALFAATFALYFAAIRVAIRCPETWRLGWAIIAPALLFRCILVPTDPIQEIDVYRYLWDGAVSARGLNPYRFAPAQVSAVDSEIVLNEELRSLVRLRDSSPAMAEVLGRIHYADLTTVYPPVSQAVFAVGNWLAPHDASAGARVVILKMLLMTFDIGTIALVWLLLKAAGKHPGWVVTYAWCPLVMKEFSNTGHLDSIAAFFTTAAVWCVVRLFARNAKATRTSWLLVGAILLALAVGTKLYAIVLLPVLCAAIAARARLSYAAMFAAVAALLSAACLTPMLLTAPVSVDSPPPVLQGASDLSPEKAIESNAATEVINPPVPTTGLNAFVTGWEMNDFLFMLVLENIGPVDSNSQPTEAWFTVTPNAWREAIVIPIAKLLETDVKTAAFLATRIATTCVFLTIAVAFAWRVYQHANVNTVLEAAFLTLAWFWLLSPTQNPWYWIWALPLLPFARNRAWYAMSGLVMLYYVRFWLGYQFPDGPTFGIAYEGPRVFDFIVTWLEYAPWYAWLGIAAWRRHKQAASNTGRGACVGSFTETFSQSAYHSEGLAITKE